MIENIKSATKIAGKTALKWITIFVAGNVITLITFLIALYRNVGVAGGGHGSVVGLFVGLITTNFFAFLLIFGAPIFLILYFIIANKISIQHAIYLLWDGKAGDYVSDKVGAIAQRITAKEGWRNELTNKAVLKAKILASSKADPSASKFQRKVIKYVLKKIRLDDVNFQDESLDLSAMLSTKFKDFISETAKPSWKLFWILALIQIGLLVASFVV